MAVTVGTDTYVSVADADAYFLNAFNAEAWKAATEVQKEQALVTATRTIDRQRLKGYKSDPDQTLQFPRLIDTSRIDWDVRPSQRYVTVPKTVPQKVIDACCEQASFFLSMTPYEQKRERSHQLGMVGGGVGNANEYSAQTIIQAKMQNSTLCTPTRELLKPYLGGAVILA